MSVKAKSQVVCPDCRYRQKGEKKVCAKCGRSLKGVDRQWWVFTDHLGKKKAKKVGSRDAALEVARKFEARLTLGDLGFMEDSPKTPTFQECAEQWYETYVKPNLSASTRKAYQRVLKKHAYPHMGNLRLDQIKRKHIRDLIAEKKGAGLSRDTVAQITSVCSGIFSHAIEDGLVEVSPVTNMGKFNRRPPEVELPVHPFAEEELDTFLGKVQKHWSFYHPLFFTLAKTGIRIGEAMALDWSNVDFQDRSLLIERSYTDGRMGPPKGRRARKVDLSQDTVRVLKQHYKDVMELKLQKGWQELQPVFPNIDGGRLELSNLRNRVFVKTLKKAGLGHRRIHDLRHTYASLLLMKGTNVLYVGNQLGHRSVDVTLQRYARWIPSDDRKEVDRLDSRQPNETHAKPEVG